jgi:MoxR-like ATPase
VVDIAEINARVRDQSHFVAALREEVAKIIVGQQVLVDRLLTGLFCGGHILIEGVPGLAKTLTVQTLAQAIDASFVRIQFAPDLLPADIVGTMVFNPRDQTFEARRGPVFSNIVLADEINRAPPKVQSALLEAMQERQVSFGGQTLPLPQPFMVLATQNPIEHEGTYPLPEAQLDRFLLKVLVHYPSRQEEREILERGLSGATPTVSPVITPDEVLTASRDLLDVHIEDGLKDYIVRLVAATRDPDAFRLAGLRALIAFGASPRAALSLAAAARANAFLQGRGYVTPDDVKALAPDVLRHRLVVTYEAEAQELTTDHIIVRVLEGVDLPS